MQDHDIAETTLLDILRFIWKSRRTLAIGAVAGAMIGGAVVLYKVFSNHFPSEKYESTTWTVSLEGEGSFWNPNAASKLLSPLVREEIPKSFEETAILDILTAVNSARKQANQLEISILALSSKGKALLLQAKSSREIDKIALGAKLEAILNSLFQHLNQEFQAIESKKNQSDLIVIKTRNTIAKEILSGNNGAWWDKQKAFAVDGRGGMPDDPLLYALGGSKLPEQKQIQLLTEYMAARSQLRRLEHRLEAAQRLIDPSLDALPLSMVNITDIRKTETPISPTPFLRYLLVVIGTGCLGFTLAICACILEIILSNLKAELQHQPPNKFARK